MSIYLQRNGSYKVIVVTRKVNATALTPYYYPVGTKLEWSHTQQQWWQYDKYFNIVYYDDITYKINGRIDAIVKKTRYTKAEVKDTLNKHKYDDRDSLETFMNNHSVIPFMHDIHYMQECRMNPVIIRDAFSPDMQNINNRHLMPAHARDHARPPPPILKCKQRRVAHRQGNKTNKTKQNK